MNKKIIQILFWIAFSVYNLFDELSYSKFSESLQSSLTFTAIIVILVYLNILLLIPKFLYKKKSLGYIFFFVLTSVILVFLNIDNFSHFIFEDFIFELVQTLLIVGGISSVWITQEQIRTKEKLSLIEKDQIATNLKFLKNQINPHFLFNALNNINFLINQNSEKASEVLVNLSNLLRYQLYDTDVELIEIEKEIDHLKNYIELEKIRVSDRLILKENINCEVSNFKIAPFLILPLIENAFKHGIGRETSYISFWLNITKDRFDLKIENSMPKKAKQNKNNGLGINNLKQRLDLLYENNYFFTHSIINEKYITQLIINL